MDVFHGGGEVERPQAAPTASKRATPTTAGSPSQDRSMWLRPQMTRNDEYCPRNLISSLPQWSARSIADEFRARGAAAHTGAVQPHRWRYWLTPAEDAAFERTVTDVCTPYREAPARAAQGERTVRTDELTGMHALEHKHPSLPMAGGCASDAGSSTCGTAPRRFS